MAKKDKQDDVIGGEVSKQWGEPTSNDSGTSSKPNEGDSQSTQGSGPYSLPTTGEQQAAAAVSPAKEEPPPKLLPSDRREVQRMAHLMPPSTGLAPLPEGASREDKLTHALRSMIDAAYASNAHMGSHATAIAEAEAVLDARGPSTDQAPNTESGAYQASQTA